MTLKIFKSGQKKHSRVSKRGKQFFAGKGNEKYQFTFKLGDFVKDTKTGKIGTVVEIFGPAQDPDVKVRLYEPNKTPGLLEVNPRRLKLLSTEEYQKEKKREDPTQSNHKGKYIYEYLYANGEKELLKRNAPLSLADLQNLVGGYIEMHPDPTDPSKTLVMNEEARIDSEKPYKSNQHFPEILGNIVRGKIDKNGDFVGV